MLRWTIFSKRHAFNAAIQEEQDGSLVDLDCGVSSEPSTILVEKEYSIKMWIFLTRLRFSTTI